MDVLSNRLCLSDKQKLLLKMDAHGQVLSSSLASLFRTNHLTLLTQPQSVILYVVEMGQRFCESHFCQDFSLFCFHCGYSLSCKYILFFIVLCLFFFFFQVKGTLCVDKNVSSTCLLQQLPLLQSTFTIIVFFAVPTKQTAQLRLLLPFCDPICTRLQG